MPIGDIGLSVLGLFLPANVMYELRPMIKLPQQLILGMGNGYLGFDLRSPFYCFTDGIIDATGSLLLSEKYAQIPNDPYLRTNILDLTIPLLFKCNPLNTGIISTFLYLYSNELVQFIST